MAIAAARKEAWDDDVNNSGNRQSEIMALNEEARSLLQEVIAITPINASIIEAAKEFAALKYEHRISALSWLSGDGITCHGAYNRRFANNVVQVANSHATQGIIFDQNRRKFDNEDYLCDVVFASPYKGQLRFGLQRSTQTGARRILLLHMSGSLSDLSLSVASIGKARAQYLKGQNVQVPKNECFHLPHSDIDQTTMLENESEAPLCLLMVTDLRGLGRNELKMSLCLPDGQFDAQSGLISLAARYELYNGLIHEIAALHSNESLEPTTDAGIGFEISELEKPKAEHYQTGTDGA